MNQKVQQLADDINKLSPGGKDLIMTVLNGKPSGSIKRFLDAQEEIAKKYKCKISIGYQVGLEHKEVVIADARGGESMNNVPIVNEIKADNQANVIVNLEDLIKNHVSSIDKLQAEIKQVREQFEDGYQNNPTYREASEKAKDSTKAKTQIRAEIVRNPSMAALKQKLKDLRFDLNEQKKTLSDLLVDYKDQTGATQLELFDGRTMEIIESASLVRAK